MLHSAKVFAHLNINPELLIQLAGKGVFHPLTGLDVTPRQVHIARTFGMGDEETAIVLNNGTH
jgi:hypothetical protein